MFAGTQGDTLVKVPYKRQLVGACRKRIKLLIASDLHVNIYCEDVLCYCGGFYWGIFKDEDSYNDYRGER